ncbi:MAG: hypothetical protein IT374_08440 [Polyangiaceae bacterium]|nr:hypothetical protein [Polyangiaceae bacterium]
MNSNVCTNATETLPFCAVRSSIRQAWSSDDTESMPSNPPEPLTSA